MKVLMISTDRGLFKEDSNVSKRFEDYSKIFEELHVIVFTQKGFSKRQISENVFIYPTDSLSKIFYISNAIKMGSKLDVNVVSSQDAFLTGLVARKLAKTLKAKFHVQVHTDVFSEAFKSHSFVNKIQALIAEILLERADAIRVVSKRIFESLKKIKVKTEPFILPIAIDIEKFNKEKMVLKKDSVFNILTVSRFESEKNVSLAIEAFAEVCKNRNDIDFTIIGSGSLDIELKELTLKLGVTDKLKFVGEVQNTEDYFNNTDIYIQTSKYEGYGMALIEAAYFGLPIVTTDVGVVGEVLVDGGSCLVSKSNKNDFADKILKLIDDDILRKNIGERAKESALKHIQTKDEYLENYKKAFLI